MSEIQTSRSPDLAKLEAEGFRLRIVQGNAYHLLIEGVPSVTPDRKVVRGTLYCPLEIDVSGQTVNPCSNHQCWWIGDPPCDSTGRVMTEMISNPEPENKGDGIVTTVGFSRINPDKSKYKDFYEKVRTYIELIWHPAHSIDKDCDPRTERPVKAVVDAQNRVFRYPDMATTRAGIGAATTKLLINRVGIIGLGGTGSYILDLISKTPVNEIHIFDGDQFELHNAYRSPGAPKKEEITNPLKVDWFWNIYDKMHSGIIRHPYYVQKENIDELSDFDFVFIAIDDSESRGFIINRLIEKGVPFIDVGMDIGLDKHNSLRGICRFTLGTPDFHDHVEKVVSFTKTDLDVIYRNIQIADINMLNASMAVGKWKQYLGFYADDVHEHHSLYTLSTHGLTKEYRS